MNEKSTVLIIDDEAANIMTLTHILRDEYVVRAVKSGREGVELAKAHLPDVILLDILMPDMDGFQVLKELKTDGTRDIPVIFITGLSSSADEEQGLKLGASDYITKPFTSSIVKLRISRQIQMKQQIEAIEHLSLTDHTTGLPNRRSFEQRLLVEWTRAKREKESLSILIADLDNFKKFNDTYGHLQGDMALKIFSVTFGSIMKRMGDFAARWGGEEFVALLPNTDVFGSLNVAERIRAGIEALTPEKDGIASQITVSIGANTLVHPFESSFDEFFSHADEALYRAKNSGRNKVCHFQEEEVTAVLAPKARAEDKVKKTIFIVDDNATNLAAAKNALKDSFQLYTLPSAKKMFDMLSKVKPDLILLDIEMPEVNGLEALNILKTNPAYADIPIVVLTGVNDTDIELRGFQLGVVDFILKPFSEPVLKRRIQSHLDMDYLIRERTRELQDKTDQLQSLKTGIVVVLADVVERRDATTGSHIDRTTLYIDLLIKKMLETGLYSEIVSKWNNLELLISAARLHDVGKIAIPDAILNKPGKLTDEEFEIIKTHTTEGEEIINKIISHTATQEAFLENAKLFAGYHHERWDGGGYPYGLKETDIPIQGRIMAFADVYDALITIRPYKKAFTHEESVKIIMDSRGKQFDPYIADVFYSIQEEFRKVAERLK
ncbi:MAG: response regulator [Defluviitaleaceae bacterium]|nr:response regulator [Defluviitaleaceae bacterium]